MKLLELNDVTVSFQSPDGSRMTALRDMSLSVEQGELVALVGPSGCGKSTALNVLAGQVRPVSGQVRLAGEPVKGVSPSVGYISQADTLLPWRTVLDNVAFGPLDALTKEKLQDEILALWESTGCTILYVTHDLTEAITLADRVVLMSARPGRVVREYPIDLPRPRRVMDVKFSPRFVELERAIWQDLQGELHREEGAQ